MTKTTTGVDLIRSALRNRAKHGHLGTLARDLTTAASSEDFLHGAGTLSTETLQTLAKDLFPYAEFDPVLDLMKPINRTEPRPLGVLPSPYPKSSVTFERPARGPPPLTPAKPKPREPRPGWLGGGL
jgi:hypothetical protein